MSLHLFGETFESPTEGNALGNTTSQTLVERLVLDHMTGKDPLMNASYTE